MLLTQSEFPVKVTPSLVEVFMNIGTFSEIIYGTGVWT